MPGNVHLDLMDERIIDDPFYRLNERGVQWVDKSDWMYTTTFTPTAGEMAAKNKELVFKGLDTIELGFTVKSLLRATDTM